MCKKLCVSMCICLKTESQLKKKCLGVSHIQGI